jgi:hypothetical protein
MIPLDLSGNRSFLRTKITPVDLSPIEGLFANGALGRHTAFIEKYKLRPSNQKSVPHVARGLGYPITRLKSFGEPGDQTGQFNTPHRVERNFRYSLALGDQGQWHG